MTAIAVDQIVARLVEKGGGADGDRFLPAVKMAESADLAALLNIRRRFALRTGG